MSVYQGFATRNQETQYNQLVSLLILTLSKRLIKLYNQEDCNEKAFRSVFNRIHSGLKTLETIKYMEPKYSQLLKQLNETLQVQQNIQNEKFTQLLIGSQDFEEIQKEAQILLKNQCDVIQKDEVINLIKEGSLLNSEISQHASSNPQNQQLLSVEERKLTQLQEDKNNKSQLRQTETQIKAEKPIIIRNKVVPRQFEYVQLTTPTQKTNRSLVIGIKTPNLKNQSSHDIEQQIIEEYSDQIHLPQLNQLDGTQISDEIINRITKNVEDSILSKLITNQGMKKKKRAKKKGINSQHLQGFDLFFKKDISDEKLDISLLPFQSYNHSIRNKNHRQIVMPFSEQNRTRPKFYSVGK